MTINDVGRSGNGEKDLGSPSLGKNPSPQKKKIYKIKKKLKGVFSKDKELCLFIGYWLLATEKNALILEPSSTPPQINNGQPLVTISSTQFSLKV